MDGPNAPRTLCQHNVLGKMWESGKPWKTPYAQCHPSPRILHTPRTWMLWDGVCLNPDDLTTIDARSCAITNALLIPLPGYNCCRTPRKTNGNALCQQRCQCSLQCHALIQMTSLFHPFSLASGFLSCPPRCQYQQPHGRTWGKPRHRSQETRRRQRTSLLGPAKKASCTWSKHRQNHAGNLLSKKTQPYLIGVLQQTDCLSFKVHQLQKTPTQ